MSHPLSKSFGEKLTWVKWVWLNNIWSIWSILRSRQGTRARWPIPIANGSSPSGPVPIQTEEVKPPEVLKRRGVEAPEMDARVGWHTRLLTSTCSFSETNISSFPTPTSIFHFPTRVFRHQPCPWSNLKLWRSSTDTQAWPAFRSVCQGEQSSPDCALETPWAPEWVHEKAIPRAEAVVKAAPQPPVPQDRGRWYIEDCRRVTHCDYLDDSEPILKVLEGNSGWDGSKVFCSCNLTFLESLDLLERSFNLSLMTAAARRPPQKRRRAAALIFTTRQLLNSAKCLLVHDLYMTWIWFVHDLYIPSTRPQRQDEDDFPGLGGAEMANRGFGRGGLGRRDGKSKMRSGLPSSISLI